MAKIIRTSGKVIELKPTGDERSVRKRDITLAIGGSPRIITLTFGRVMVIRDDQSSPKLAKNPSASSIHTGVLKTIRGDVLYGKSEEFEL